MIPWTRTGTRDSGALSSRNARLGAVRAGWTVLLAAVLCSAGGLALAGQYETVVSPLTGPTGTNRPPHFGPERSWSRGRLGFVTDSLLMQLRYHPQLGFGDVCPDGPTRVGRADFVDSVYVYLGPIRSDDKRTQYEVFLTATSELGLGGALARLHISRGRKGPYREPVLWFEEPPGDDLIDPTYEGGAHPTGVADTTRPEPLPVSAAKGGRWVTFWRDTMVVRIEIDPAAMSLPVWLPAARRWTADSDETARFTVAAAFYWIRELHFRHPIRRNPSAGANDRAWRYAERVLGATLSAY